MRITVSGLTGAEAGTIEVLDELGQPFPLPAFQLPAPNAGGVSSVDVPQVPIGTYILEYQPPIGHQVLEPPIVAGVYSRTVIVTTGGLATASFLVAESPPPAEGLIFASDFSTATGKTTAALNDTGSATPWLALFGTWGEIIPSTGLGFPSANVRRTTATEPSGFDRSTINTFPAMAIGDRRYYRWYFRAAWKDSLSDGQNHPIEAAGATPWAFDVLHNQGGPGKYQQYYGIQGEVGNNYRFYCTTLLDKHVTYRFELSIERVGTSTMELHARVYDAAGVLLFDDADYRNEGNTVSLTDNPALNIANLTNLNSLQCGIEGLGGTDWFPSMIYSYQGCFAVSDSDWCGPYVLGEGAA